MSHETPLESADIKSLERLSLHQHDSGLQSRRNFGGRAYMIILVKIIAVIFDFYNSRRLGRERNVYQGGEWQYKRRGDEGWGYEYELLHKNPQ